MPKKTKDTTVDDLVKKIKELELKLLNASEWMTKNVAEKKDIIDGNIEEVNVGDIEKTIHTFLGEYPLGADEGNIVDDLLSSEILFVHMQRDPNIDGTAIIIGYNKVLDFAIEKLITSTFRQFASKRCKNILLSSNHIEGNLHSTIHKGYMLSIGRLYEVIENIKFNYQKEFYLSLFSDFLETHHDIKQILLDDAFFLDLKSLVDTEIFGSKRHTGSVSFEDATQARKKIMGNFQDKNCLFIKILQIGETL